MMSWSWSGFAQGLGEGAAKFGEMGVATTMRYQLESQLLQEKAAIEREAEAFRAQLSKGITEHKGRFEQALAKQTRQDAAAEMQTEATGIINRQTFDKAKANFENWRTADDTPVDPATLNKWEDLEPQLAEKLKADPKNQATQVEIADAYMQAGVKQGLVNPKDFAEYHRKSAEDKIETAIKVHQLKNDDQRTANDTARTQAYASKAGKSGGGGGGGSKDTTSLIKTTDALSGKLIELDKKITSLPNDRKHREEKARLQGTYDALYDQVGSLEAEEARRGARPGRPSRLTGLSKFGNKPGGAGAPTSGLNIRGNLNSKGEIIE